jgi:GTP-binding protein
MIIHSAKFIISSVDVSKCPPPKYPEYAFIGRSNVGKSSLINCLVARKDLAKTSERPGKTQTINHFLVNEKQVPWYLVDLPGYGYARVSKEQRLKWEKFIIAYLKKRESLQWLFVLVDSRIPPQGSDLDFIRDAGLMNLPLAVVFTKTDKLSQSKTEANVKAFKQKLLENWEELPPCFMSSALSGRGRREILELIGKTNQEFQARL